MRLTVAASATHLARLVMADPKFSRAIHLIALWIVVRGLETPSQALIFPHGTLLFLHLKKMWLVDSGSMLQRGQTRLMSRNLSRSRVGNLPSIACHVVKEYFGGIYPFHTNFGQYLCSPFGLNHSYASDVPLDWNQVPHSSSTSVFGRCCNISSRMPSSVFISCESRSRALQSQKERCPI